MGIQEKVLGHGANAQPRNWLQAFLLISLEQWRSYGYELMRTMTTFGFTALEPGGVYRTLRQLERDGLIQSDWDTSHDGPARRMYGLTEAGHAYLRTWADALRGYQAMLDSFFSIYPRASAGEQPPPGHAGKERSARAPLA